MSAKRRILDAHEPIPLSEGVFVHLLGLVVIASSPGRFWLGFALAVIPIAVGPLLKVYDSARSSRAAGS